MKKLGMILVVMFLVIGITGYTVAQRGERPERGRYWNCDTIPRGEIPYSAGHYFNTAPNIQSISPGYDDFGYNYQAHMFLGSYANSYLGKDGFPPYMDNANVYEAENPTVVDTWYWQYRDVILMMQWNDAWLSNKDCDKDGLLDRHYPLATYIGSGAWLTNHQFGIEGEDCPWNYFTKIVAAPADATAVGGVWYAADGTEIGPVIWGSFATILTVYNDPCTGDHGIEYLSPAGPGFGKY